MDSGGIRSLCRVLADYSEFLGMTGHCNRLRRGHCGLKVPESRPMGCISTIDPRTRTFWCKCEKMADIRDDSYRSASYDMLRQYDI